MDRYDDNDGANENNIQRKKNLVLWQKIVPVCVDFAEEVRRSMAFLNFQQLDIVYQRGFLGNFIICARQDAPTTDNGRIRHDFRELQLQLLILVSIRKHY